MVVVRAYPVMGRLTVEITCAGHDGQPDGAGHLLLRAQLTGDLDTLGDMLSGVGDVVGLAWRQWTCGELDETSDCVL